MAYVRRTEHFTPWDQWNEDPLEVASGMEQPSEAIYISTKGQVNRFDRYPAVVADIGNPNSRRKIARGWH